MPKDTHQINGRGTLPPRLFPEVRGTEVSPTIVLYMVLFFGGGESYLRNIFLSSK